MFETSPFLTTGDGGGGILATLLFLTSIDIGLGGRGKVSLVK